MSTWFTTNLGDAMLAGESLDQIKKLFDAEILKADEPGEMAVFVRHESEGHLHCEVRVYFPPTTALLAELLGATPCPKPSPDNLGLLAGSADAWNHFFKTGTIVNNERG